MFISWWPQDNTAKCLLFSSTQHNTIQSHIRYTNRADLMNAWVVCSGIFIRIDVLMCLLASIVNIEYSILNIGEFLQLLIESLHLDHFISASKKF